MEAPTSETATDATGLPALWQRLSGIDFFGKTMLPVPEDAALPQALRDGALLLPRVYDDSFIAQVQAGLPRLLAMRQAGQIHPGSFEMVTGAIYQHGPGSTVAAPLRRFSAVVSDLYRSFLDSAQRRAAGIAMRETLPPLAVFQHDGSDGPITIAVDLIGRVLGGKAGVVSLPATMADHPVLWAALAHETGGHDVTHADPDLLAQLSAGLQAVLAATPVPGLPSDRLVALWQYWIDEASADVYGLLNVGPAFADNLALFLAVLGGGPAPSLRTECRADPADSVQLLDPHPTDILRLHLALGVIDALTQLSRRDAHVQRIAALARSLATASTITLTGSITDVAGRPLGLNATLPMADMAQAARAVGSFVASAALPALGGKGIQAIETWDDDDESRVAALHAAFLAGESVIGRGDDAQLLAAATLACFNHPARYEAITTALTAALDESFATDPIWGTPTPDRLYIRYTPTR